MIANLVITGLGAITPVGLSPLQGMHSIRSGITRLALQRIPDRVRQWVAGGNLPCWTPYVQGRQLEAFARLASEQAWRYRMAAGAAPRRLAVIAVAPETLRPGFGLARSQAQASAFFSSLGLPSFVHRDVVEGGSCGAHLALQRAVDVLSSDRADACLIVAADSQLQIRVTRWHEDNFRLKCSYVADGLMPAEGAVCMIVETEVVAIATGARSIARIASVGATHEPAGILSDLPNTASGLTEAVRQALLDANVDAANLAMVWSDLNGESYRAREWAFSKLRLGVPDAAELLHPADCHGDLGSASDTSLLSMAAMCVATGWSGTKPVLVFCGSESGTRCASVVLPVEPHPASLMQVARGSARVYSSGFALPAELGPSAEDSNDPTRAAFARSLRDEHRDELVGLYYQRKAQLSQPDMPWPRLGLVERRILSHLDAVVSDGALGIATVADGLGSDEEGAVWAAALLVCTLPHPRNLDRLAALVSTASPPALAGLEAAFSLAPASAELDARLSDWLTDSYVPLKMLALGLAGATGTSARREVIACVGSSDPRVSTAACRVAMHSGWVEACAALQSVLGMARDNAVRRAAMEALLAIDPALARGCSATEGLVAFRMAIMGEPLDIGSLEDASRCGALDETAIDALGIAGQPAGIPLLLQLLQSSDRRIRAASARSLALISGMRSVGSIPIMNGPDPDPEFDEVALEVSAVPASNAARWERWWRGVAADASLAVRWRLGRAFDHASCVDEIAEATSARSDRERAHLELLTVSRSAIRFDTASWVSDQERAIAEWHAWRQHRSRG